jgi:hypothetical protein
MRLAQSWLMAKPYRFVAMLLAMTGLSEVFNTILYSKWMVGSIAFDRIYFAKNNSVKETSCSCRLKR